MDNLGRWSFGPLPVRLSLYCRWEIETFTILFLSSKVHLFASCVHIVVGGRREILVRTCFRKKYKVISWGACNRILVMPTSAVYNYGDEVGLPLLSKNTGNLMSKGSDVPLINDQSVYISLYIHTAPWKWISMCEISRPTVILDVDIFIFGASNVVKCGNLSVCVDYNLLLFRLNAWWLSHAEGGRLIRSTFDSK